VLGLVPCHQVFGLLVNLCTSLLQGCAVVNVPDFDKTHLLRAMDHYHVSLVLSFMSVKYHVTNSSGIRRKKSSKNEKKCLG